MHTFIANSVLSCNGNHSVVLAVRPEAVLSFKNVVVGYGGTTIITCIKRVHFFP